MSKGITLYHHSRIGEELGMIHLVTRNPGAEDEWRLHCSSERGRDFGVIYTVELYDEAYQGLCEENEVETLEGCIVRTSDEDIEIDESPEEAPTKRPEAPQKSDNLATLKSPNMWRHNWGRCCCVHHGGGVEPVTPERIANGEVPWWGDIYTPFELDLIEAANKPEDRAMHLICDDDSICGVCGHYVWVVQEEDLPDDLPPPLEEEEGEEPLLSQSEALAQATWRNKGEAWEMFLDDPHNQKLIEASGLAIHRANDKRRFSTEKAFEKINRLPQVKRNIHSVKQAVYFALGNVKSGTWADFDLSFVRMVKGLESVDIPGEVYEELDLGDDEANASLRKISSARAARAEVDDEANALEDLLDDDAMLDVPQEFLDDEEEEEETPKVVRPRRERKRREYTKEEAKATLVQATKQLQAALGVFLQVLEEDEDEEDDDEDERYGGF